MAISKSRFLLIALSITAVMNSTALPTSARGYRNVGATMAGFKHGFGSGIGKSNGDGGGTASNNGFGSGIGSSNGYGGGSSN